VCPVALIIDDEAALRRPLRLMLEQNGYAVHEAENGADGLRFAGTLRPDVILLDWGLPDMQGIEVLRRLREYTQTPVIMLTVRDRDDDKVAALDGGADDYLTKPYSPKELLARLRVALRHARPKPETEVYTFGRLSVDLTTRTVRCDGEQIHLTPTEYAILRMLITNAGRAITHKQLLREVWGNGYEDETHYLRVYIGQLRGKVEPNPDLPSLIITEPGVGYRLISEEHG
jgi:two-component system, OmpR family, KDP operon response regulator KdpE